MSGAIDLRAAVAGTLLAGFDGHTLPEWVRDRLAAGLAGVCLFGENIHSPKQLRELTAAIRAAKPDAVIAIDEEGGDVTRLFYDVGSPYPGNALLGRIDDTRQTRAVAEAVGTALAEAGVTLDFAPDVDVNSNPDNPVIGVRSFGDDAELVARHSAAWVRGLQSTGVAACAKHFPGHGDTAADSHRALPVVDEPLAVLRGRELVPFTAAIDAGVKTVMTSHILLPQLDAGHPATLSRAILGTLLREELGFTGVIVSDALDMAGASGTLGIAEAAVRALDAGCDLLCIGTKNTDAQLAEIEETVLSALADGRLAEARVRSAARRVRSSLAPAPAPAPTRTLTPAPAPASTLDTVANTLAEQVAGAAVSEIEASPDMTIADVQRGFDVTEQARSWIARGPADVIVQVQTPANEAIGSAPWNPFDGIAVAVSATSVATIDELRRDRAGSRVLIVGRDNHQHAWVRTLIDDLRRTNDVLVVDMGWPDARRDYADVATFGASRLVGDALRDAVTRPHHERLAR